MANNTLIYYEIRTPDHENKLIGFRWVFETAAFFMASKHMFSSRGSAARSAERFITKHDFDYQSYKVMDKARGNEQFLV